MAMTLGQFAELAEPGLSNIWHDSLQPVEEQFARLANIRDMEKATIKDAKMAGFGSLVVQDEGASITYDEAIAPITKTYDFTIYGLGYKITEKLADWELYGEVERLERDLQRSSTDHIEQFVAAIYNNATNTTISAGFDGLSLANTAHTRLDGGSTFANRPTSTAALSLAGLQDAIIHFKTLVNDRGRPINARGETLLIPPDLELTAMELIQSEMRPDTANNAINAVNRFGLSVFVSRYLSTTTFWGMIGNFHDINLFWAKRPETGMEVDFDTDTIKRKVRQGYARGHGEARGFYLGNT